MGLALPVTLSHEAQYMEYQPHLAFSNITLLFQYLNVYKHTTQFLGFLEASLEAKD